MGSRYEAEITISSAKDLKNINWRYGKIKPYAVVWIDPKSKCSTRVDEEGDVFPYWDQTLIIPFNSPIEESTLYIDIVHAKSPEEDIKPLIGSAKLPLREVVDDVGLGRKADKKLVLKRPSGRPHGKLEVKVNVRQPSYRAPDPYNTPPYGVPNRDYPAPPPAYGHSVPYGAPPASYGAPPASYGAPPVNAYGAPPVGYPYGGQAPPAPYGQPAYGQPGYGQPAYGQPGYGQPPSAYGGSSQGYVEEKKKGKFGGMGVGGGLAVGAVAGVLGGLALVEGAEYVEDKIADDAAEKVEEDLGYDDSGDGDW